MTELHHVTFRNFLQRRRRIEDKEKTEEFDSKNGGIFDRFQEKTMDRFLCSSKKTTKNVEHFLKKTMTIFEENDDHF